MSKFDLVIIGAGVSGIVTMRAAIKNRKFKKIALIDERGTVGGLPYNTEQDEKLLLNESPYGVGLDSKNPLEFVQWLHDNPEIANKYNVQIVEKENGELESNQRFVSRKLYGEYCAAILEKEIINAQENGIEITQTLKTKATTLEKIKDDWKISLENKYPIESENVILALGHLPSNALKAFEQNNHYYANPFGDLSNIDKQSAVIVVGSNLTAIDAVRKLSLQKHEGTIYITSPHGTFPVVKNPVPQTKQADYKLQYLTPSALEKIESFTLENVLQLFEQEMRFCLDQKAFDLKKSFKEWQRQEKDPKQWLKTQITIVKSGKYRRWQLMLDEIYFEILPILCQKFSEEDYKEFLQEYYGPYLKHASGIPLPNAEMLLNAMENGQVKVIAGFDEKNIRYENNKFIMNSETTLTADHLINATGPGKEISTNPLLKDMQDKGLIYQHAFGGVAADINTHQVKNKDGQLQKGLYTLGPTTLGENIGSFAIIHSLKEANQIVEEICNCKINSVSVSENSTVKTLFTASTQKSTERKVLDCRVGLWSPRNDK